MCCLKVFLILVIFIITAVHSNVNVHIYVHNSTDGSKSQSGELKQSSQQTEQIQTSVDEGLSKQLLEFRNMITNLRTDTFHLLDEQKQETTIQLTNMQNILLEQNKEIKLQLRDMQNNLKDVKNDQKQHQTTLTNVRSEIRKENQEKPEKIPETHNENTNKKGHYPSNCAEAVPKGGTSGVYTIQLPVLNAVPSMVYCLVDPGGGDAWTIIQRRQDGMVDFYRNWEEYKKGFGNLYGEFFLGLDLIHALTNQTNNELWIELQDFENVTKYAKYSSFGIGNEMDAYALYHLGDYKGDARDSMKYHKGCKFSTIDRDNDNLDGSCADRKQGAWWYNKCQESNLNGRYLRGFYSKYLDSQGVIWGNWRGYYYSLKYTHMAIRPAKIDLTFAVKTGKSSRKKLLFN